MISVEALKNKVLDLAMHGKLVAQDPQDEPASVLIEKIKEEKAQLIKDKKIKRTKALPPIEEDEIPYEIPDSWEWVRLGKLLFVKSGKAFKRKNLVKNGDYPVYGANGIIGYANDYNVKSKKLLLGRVGSVGEINIIEEKAWITDNALIVNLFDDELFDYMYKLFEFIDFNKYASGAVQPVISGKRLYNIVIPLPPQQEQQRIVDKIEEIFDELDKLDEASQKYDECKELLNKRVLDLAMHGKLVAQDSQDEPASVLIEKIKEEKAQLIKDKKIKKTKALPPIEEDEIPYEIPDSWEWVRLDDISNIIMGQAPKGIDVLEGVPKDGYYEFHQGKSYFGNMYLKKSSKITKISNKIIDAKNIVMSVRAPVGDVNLTANPIAIGRGLAGIIPIGCNVDYMYYFLKTQKKNLMKKSTGTTFKAINANIIKNMMCLVPPIKEQQRIVDKIEEIFDTLREI